MSLIPSLHWQKSFPLRCLHRSSRGTGRAPFTLILCFLVISEVRSIVDLSSNQSCTPVWSGGGFPLIQCDRTVPCIHEDFLVNDNFRVCRGRRHANWPTFETHVVPTSRILNFGDVLGLLKGKVFLFAGDSLTRQTYYAALCGAAGAGVDVQTHGQFYDDRADLLEDIVKTDDPVEWRVDFAASPYNVVLVYIKCFTLDSCATRFEAALRLADVAVVGLGLHYGSNTYHEKFRNDTDRVFKVLDDHLHTSTKVAFVQEVSAQHFQFTGTYHAELHKYELGNGTRNPCQCQALTGRPSDMQTQFDSWIVEQNAILGKLATRFSSVRIWPFYDLTQPRFDVHVGKFCQFGKARKIVRPCCDCTHFCYSPVFWDAHFSDLFDLLYNMTGAQLEATAQALLPGGGPRYTIVPIIV
eukprot:jgi/Mesvir1/16225/Mv08479-RA.1